ncbi:MAG: DUF92 domain-containing protein [Acidobacteriota bacterium]
MSRAPRFSEDVRKLVHVAFGSCAVLLRFLTWWEAAVLAGAALAFNLYALPRIAGPRLYRPDEAAHRFASGITLYPLVILLLLLAVPDRRDIVAAAWGVLAFGDGMATVAGRRIVSPRIPWNRDKSVAGSAAFVLFGGAAAAALCWWCRPVIVPPPYVWFSVAMPFVAAAAAAAVETIPITLNDNLSVPATAAAVLWWTSLINEDLVADLVGTGAGRLVAAIAANVAVAAAGYFARTVTIPGASCGALLGVTILLTTGWGGWGLLLATFGLAVLTSRVGLRRKTELGIAEERDGRRGAGNAFANTGIAAAAAVLAATSYAAGPARLACVAALAAGGSDTVASEIGKAWGRRTFLVPTLRRVAAGTSGAISIEGTAAGLLGALVLGAIGVAAGLVPGRMLLAVVAGATIGAFAESLLGATLEERGILNNDVLNFLNTAIAAGASICIAGMLA